MTRQRILLQSFWIGYLLHVLHAPTVYQSLAVLPLALHVKRYTMKNVFRINFRTPSLTYWILGGAGNVWVWQEMVGLVRCKCIWLMMGWALN